MSLRYTATFVAVVLLAGADLIGQSATTAPADAGFVINVRGRWDIVRAGLAPLPAEPRAVLRDGDTLWKSDQDPAAAVIIALYTGDLQEVKVTTKLPPRSPGGIVERVVRALQNRFSSSDDFVKASVRGGGDFQDAVLKAEPDRTDFLAIFGDAPPGAYTMAVFALNPDGVVKRPAHATARVQVDSGAAHGPALAPGVYQVDVSDGPVGLAGSAWVRVVPANRFETAAPQLARLRAAGTGDAASMELREAIRAVARTYLIAFDDIASEPR